MGQWEGAVPGACQERNDQRESDVVDIKCKICIADVNVECSKYFKG